MIVILSLLEPVSLLGTLGVANQNWETQDWFLFWGSWRQQHKAILIFIGGDKKNHQIYFFETSLYGIMFSWYFKEYFKELIAETFPLKEDLSLNFSSSRLEMQPGWRACKWWWSVYISLSFMSRVVLSPWGS